MQEQLGAMELRFAQLIWDHAPVSSGELVRLCAEELQWKKSTTYTMLRRLCQRGIFRNEEGQVTVQMTRSQLEARESERFLRENFEGSLPRFIAAFAAGRRLSDREIDELQQLIARSREEQGDAPR